MFETLGAPELLIIFAIVVLLFGAGKVGRLGKDLGTAIREFRTAVRDDPPEGTGFAATGSLQQITTGAPEGTSQPITDSAPGSRPPAVF